MTGPLAKHFIHEMACQQAVLLNGLSYIMRLLVSATHTVGLCGKLALPG